MNKTAELGEKIFYYRLAGDRLMDIAERLGIKPESCSRALKAYTDFQASMASHEDRQSAMQLELARLDEIIRNWWLEATMGQNAAAAKIVLDSIKERVKLQRLDIPDGMNDSQVHQILVVGQSQADFIKALEAGRQAALGGVRPDNGVVPGTVEEELTL